jgi:Holliday junction resolvase-like predicted endonuclease
VTRPLSTTVSRYQRLNLSRRRGNAIRQHLAAAGIIKAVTIATRSGHVVLYDLTDLGRTVCASAHIEIGTRARESLEHRYWVRQTAKYFERQGYDVTHEHPVKGNGAIDILAQRHGERTAVEVETGKSSIAVNLAKTKNAGFDRIVFVATSATAASACQKAIEAMDPGKPAAVDLLTWLDVS